MRLRWTLLLFLPFIQGCATEYPKESDIAGTWEGISLVYILFEYESAEKAYLVAPPVEGESEEPIIGKLSNFISREKDFTLDFAGNVDGEPQTGTLIGTVYGPRIVLRFLEDGQIEEAEGESMWLMKSEEFDRSRAAARAALNDFVRSTEAPGD